MLPATGARMRATRAEQAMMHFSLPIASKERGTRESSTHILRRERLLDEMQLTTAAASSEHQEID
jgi:hypothetical protein